jgi:hypothetical protein
MNQECPQFNTQEDKSVDNAMELRAHHLFSFSTVRWLGAHKSLWKENFARNFKEATAGRKRGREYTDHIVDSVLAIIKEQVGTVKIIDTRDEICKKCPQRENVNCIIAGREWTQNFLSMMDQAVAKNTNGVLEIGKEYPSSYLNENIGVIRSAMRKTLLELPGLWKADKELQKKIIKEEERGK